jgi:hypothetical protein
MSKCGSWILYHRDRTSSQSEAIEKHPSRKAIHKPLRNIPAEKILCKARNRNFSLSAPVE